VPTDRYAGFPEGFFSRVDETPDGAFYTQPRLVTHIDDGAISAVGELYAELEMVGELVDLCSSWISHLLARPAALAVVGMNRHELERNPFATEVVVTDLNTDPTLPFADATFDGAMCAVSVDYLTRPLEVFDEVARVLRPDAPFVCTFSNRCFPTKAIRGWLATDDATHVSIVAEYFRRSGPWGPTSAQHRNPGERGDPLFAVWARRADDDADRLAPDGDAAGTG
jgi:SAM-dependent methyltransferase